MRIQNSEVVTASCFRTMEGKDVNGGTVPVTDIKFSPTSNDTNNSNGILSPPTTPSTATPSENDFTPAPTGSGRFKFFKDGKFILELWHHKNGERMFWIPVPKNSTYWPAAGQCTPRQESSTSLSVSDDNSSIQSSPWQRDHCWKQSIPRKNINRELEFTMSMLRSRRMQYSWTAIRRTRRRPYQLITFNSNKVKDEPDGEVKMEFCGDETKSLKEFKSCKTRSGIGDDCRQPKSESRAPRETDAEVKMEFCGDETKSFKEFKCKMESVVGDDCRPPKSEPRAYEAEKIGTGYKRRCFLSKRKLGEVVQKLMERKSYESAVSSCRTDPGILSPRKRILKELEKVSLEEMGNANKKHRAKTFINNTPCSTVTVVTGTVFGQPTTAAQPVVATTSTTKSTSSHSISAILSRDEESSFLRNLLKSPNEMPPSETKSSFPVEEIRSPRQSHCSTPGASVSPPYSKSLHCPQPLPPYIQSPYLYPSAQPFLASPPVSNHPPYYPTFPSTFRDSSIWPVPSVSSLPRQSVYPSTSVPSYPVLNPSPWVSIAHAQVQSYPVTENGTDVPLNLSKH